MPDLCGTALHSSPKTPFLEEVVEVMPSCGLLKALRDNKLFFAKTSVVFTVLNVTYTVIVVYIRLNAYQQQTILHELCNIYKVVVLIHK